MSRLLKLTKKIADSPFAARLSAFHQNQMGYRKIGLRLDDMIPEENGIVKEALRRLTPNEAMDRLFRFRRALHLSANQAELPKSEWTSVEQDIPYMRTLMRQIEAEIETKQTFDTLTKIPQTLMARNQCSR